MVDKANGADRYSPTKGETPRQPYLGRLTKGEQAMHRQLELARRLRWVNKPPIRSILDRSAPAERDTGSPIASEEPTNSPRGALPSRDADRNSPTPNSHGKTEEGVHNTVSSASAKGKPPE